MDIAKLPAASRDKLAILAQQAFAADTLLEETQRQIIRAEYSLTELPGLINQRDSSSDPNKANAISRDIASREHEASRLRGVLADVQQRSTALRRIVTGLHQYVANLPANCVLEPVERNPTKGDDVASVRKRIADCKRARSAIETASPTPDDLKPAVRKIVESLADEGRPRMIIWPGGKVEPRFGEPSPGSSVPGATRPTDLFAFLCWYDRDKMIARLQAELEVQADPNSLPEPARTERRRKITREIKSLEYAEESLIEDAAAKGIDIARRSDTTSLAILGVRIVAAASAKAAA